MSEKQLDVLFIEPNATQNYQALAARFAAIETPTWSLLLANAMRAKGLGCAILDCNADRLSAIESAQKVLDYNARLNVFVVYGQNPNSSTTNMKNAYEVAMLLKSHSAAKIGFIGSHTSALPQEVIAEPFVDYVFVGDGVYALTNILQTNLEDSLDKVKGVGWKKDGTAVFNEPEIVVPQTRLDVDLPGMALDLIDLKKYRAHNWHAGYSEDRTGNFLSTYTSLGCVKKCSFCMINSINRTGFTEGYSAKDTAYIRYWSPEFIIKEFEKYAEAGIKHLRYADELFVLNRRHYEPILNGIIERGLGFNSWAYSRLDSINKDYLDLFKTAGVNWFAYGIEAANQEIRLTDIEKGKFTNINVRDVIKITREHGISVGANYIFGFEHDNFDTMKETRDLALELNTEFANFYCATALPGSSLYWTAKKNGWQLPTTFEEFSFLGYETLPLPTKYLTPAEVLRYRDEAWHEYFTNPAYLELVEKRFGAEPRKHVEDMTSIRIKRKVLGD